MNRQHWKTLLPLLLVAAAVAALTSLPTSGQAPRAQWSDRESFAGRVVAARQVLVKFRDRPQPEEVAAVADADLDEEIGGEGLRRIHSRVHGTAALIDLLSGRPDVEYVEPDFVVQAGQAPPNDPGLASLWGLLNIGQVIQGAPGAAGADIGAAAAWDVSLGSRATVVTVVDTGIDYAHPDLAANVWLAPEPFTVTVGGRLVTCAAGTHGFNAITMSCDPRDDNGHGTHMAGTIGAVGNNGAGVVGVNWTASVMAVKFLDAAGSGYVSDAINAIEFAIQAKARLGAGANVRVLSNSWTGGGYSQALLDEIQRANASDMLFVASAGNSASDNDQVPTYPASYAAANVVSVAATDNIDNLAAFSNYGSTGVHLGAPGVDVLSTAAGGGYAYGSGTSMAAPHVSGAAALVLAACRLDTNGVKNALLDTVDQVQALAGRTASGGRLDVGNALLACRASAPPADFALAVTPASVTVRRGGTAAYTVTVTGETGYSSTVALRVSGYPNGATATFMPASVTGSGRSTLAVKAGTARGNFTLTITGADPLREHSAAVKLQVK